jgi:hypothetical protein
MLDNHYFTTSLLVNLVNIYLQYFGTFSVIVNLCLSCIYCAVERLIRVCMYFSYIFALFPSRCVYLIVLNM